jgi:porphobilinogen deaminase
VRLAFLLLASISFADVRDGINHESLKVGQTIEREVGYAIGVRCDDPEVVTAEMKSRTSETNVLVLTGKRAGKTTCRAGTDPNRVSYVFAITVTGPQPRR